MRKWFVILLVLVALIVGVVVVLNFAPHGPQPGVETTFLGFTQTSNGYHAHFGITYAPRLRGWSWRDSTTTYRRGDGTWEQWAEARNSNTYNFLPPTFPRTRDGKRINTVLALPVGDTNTVWRIVLKVDEMPRWPRWPKRMAERVRDFVSRAPRPVWPTAPDQSYLLTNQTREVK